MTYVCVCVCVRVCACVRVCVWCVSVRRPQGGVELVCQDTGEWSRPLPRCTGVLCPEPPPLTHAVTAGDAADSHTLGDEVRYVCKEG